MNILLFLLLPILVVSGYALYQWFRNHQPSSIESGVDAFQREMSALSPDAAPVNRRPEPEADAPPAPAPPRPAPRRPGTEAEEQPPEDGP